MEVDITRELRTLHNTIMRSFEQSPTRKRIDNITGTNGWIIGYISDNSGKDVFQRDLEKEFGITRSTASKVVSLMAQKGLILKVNIPQDARLKKLVLTEKALALAEEMKEERNSMRKKLSGGFSDEELSQLKAYFDRIKKNVSE